MLVGSRGRSKVFIFLHYQKYPTEQNNPYPKDLLVSNLNQIETIKIFDFVRYFECFPITSVLLDQEISFAARRK